MVKKLVLSRNITMIRHHVVMSIVVAVLFAAPPSSLKAQQLELVSSASLPFLPCTSRAYDPLLSDDGRYVFFHGTCSNTVSASYIYRRDMQTSAIDLVSMLPGSSDPLDSYLLAITPDGQHALFTKGYVNNSAPRSAGFYLRDMTKGTTERVGPKGYRCGAMDGNARMFACFSGSGPRYTVIAWDRVTGTSTQVTNDPAGDLQIYNLILTPNGRYVFFDALVGVRNQVFRRDLLTGELAKVTVNLAGTDFCNGDTQMGYVSSYNFRTAMRRTVSDDGRYVLFMSNATDLVPQPVSTWSNVYRRDLLTNTTTLVSIDQTLAGAGDRGGNEPIMSADGNKVLFASRSTDLIWSHGNTPNLDAYVRDLDRGVTSLFYPAPPLGEDRLHSWPADIDADGSVMVSLADDGIGRKLFVSDTLNGQMYVIGNSAPGASSNEQNASVDPAGKFVVFESLDALVPTDTNPNADIYLLRLPQSSVVSTGKDRLVR
jgi:hypothetical protein